MQNKIESHASNIHWICLNNIRILRLYRQLSHTRRRPCWAIYSQRNPPKSSKNYLHSLTNKPGKGKEEETRSILGVKYLLYPLQRSKKWSDNRCRTDFGLVLPGTKSRIFAFSMLNGDCEISTSKFVFVILKF